MKKYSFLVYHKEYTNFLNDLREIGVLHVIEKKTGEIQDEEIKEKLNRIKEFKDAIRFLSKRNIEKVNNPLTDGNSILKELQKLWSDKELYQQKLTGFGKEIAYMEPWGDFNNKNIEKLTESGLQISFYICPTRKFLPEWEEKYHLFRINSLSGQEYFTIVHKKEEIIDIEAEAMKLPDLSLSQLIKQRNEIEGILEKTEEIYDDFAARYIPSLQKSQEQLQGDLDFTKVVLSTQKEADEKLMLLEGWVPVDDEPALKEQLDRMSIYYQAAEPKPEDNVPIKLRNNWLARLFEPIGRLYSLPNYHELDLTSLFAPFFMLFFGLCLGDAGYGLLILLAGTLAKRFLKNQKLKPYMTLGQWLGASTVVMGFFSGTFFGIPLLEVEWLSVKKYMFNSQQFFYLSMIIGLVQIFFGLCVKAYGLIHYKGFKYSLSTFGWILLFAGLAIGYFLFKKNLIPAELKSISLYSLLGVSGILILVFSDPDSNPLISSLKGIWDVYGMISGVFGDTLSYIRLFALGTSGAILGFVINSIGMQILHVAYVGPVLFVIFLLIGHSLVIGLSALGAFVHPMRLTFVEFYKNAGFAGGGKAYNPFKQK